MTDKETHMLAVVNMDWDHIKVCANSNSFHLEVCLNNFIHVPIVCVARRNFSLAMTRKIARALQRKIKKLRHENIEFFIDTVTALHGTRSTLRDRVYLLCEHLRMLITDRIVRVVSSQFMSSTIPD